MGRSIGICIFTLSAAQDKYTLLTARWELPSETPPGDYRIKVSSSYLKDTAACALCTCSTPTVW